MSSFVLLVFRIGLIVLLWLGILLALRALARDTNRVAGTSSGGRLFSRSSAQATAGSSRLREHPRHIVVVQGSTEGSRMDLDETEEIVLGRSPRCTFILDDDFASSQHARLFRRGDDWFIEDLDSRNGTQVGGHRIDQPEKVSAGSEITIGRTTVRLMP